MNIGFMPKSIVVSTTTGLLVGFLLAASLNAHSQDSGVLPATTKLYQRIGIVDRVDADSIVIHDQGYHLAPSVAVWVGLNRRTGLTDVNSGQVIGYNVIGAGPGRTGTVTGIWLLQRSDLPVNKE